MPQFFKAQPNKGKKSHSHVMYVRDDGSGITSVDNDHVHEVIVEQSEDGTVEIIVQEANGHTHDVGEMELKIDKKPAKRDEEKALEVLRLYDVAKGFDNKYRVQAKESEEFYLGKQWKTSTLEKLRAQNRSCLTINEIQPKIDALVGHQRQNRTDIKYLPVEDGDSTIADVLSKLTKNITEQSNYEFEETAAFEDEVITGRGNLYVYIDHENSLEGEIKVEKFNWQDVVYGPHEKLDGSDCEYLIKQKWVSKAKLKAMFPDKADDIEASFKLMEMGECKNFNNGDYKHCTQEIAGILDAHTHDLLDIEKKKFRILELNKVNYKRIPVLIRIDDNFFVSGEEFTKADIQAIKTIPGFRVVEKVSSSVEVSKAAGHVFLEDFDSIFSTLPMVPVYAKKKGDIIIGKVDMAKDVQREINKRHSQVADIINKTANYGYLYEKGAFTENQKAKFNKNVSVPGANLEVMDMNKIREKEGVKFPNEVVALEQLSSSKMQEIMGVNPEVLGIGTASQSGIAQVERKRQSLVTNEYLFDNLSLSKKRLGKLIIEAIVALYTPQRVSRIINNSNINALKAGELEELVLDPNTQQIYTEQQIAEIWLNADLSRYDVVVSENLNAPTNRQSSFRMWAELLVNSNLPPATYVPFLLQLSDAPGKEKFLAQLTASQQQQAQMEQSKVNAEIQKTLIANADKLPPGQQEGNIPQ